jgi:hypothetical protein
MAFFAIVMRLFAFMMRLFTFRMVAWVIPTDYIHSWEKQTRYAPIFNWLTMAMEFAGIISAHTF